MPDYTMEIDGSKYRVSFPHEPTESDFEAAASEFRRSRKTNQAGVDRTMGEILGAKAVPTASSPSARPALKPAKPSTGINSAAALKSYYGGASPAKPAPAKPVKKQAAKGVQPSMGAVKEAERRQETEARRASRMEAIFRDAKEMGIPLVMEREKDGKLRPRFMTAAEKHKAEWDEDEVVWAGNPDDPTARFPMLRNRKTGELRNPTGVAKSLLNRAMPGLGSALEDKSITPDAGFTRMAMSQLEPDAMQQNALFGMGFGGLGAFAPRLIPPLLGAFGAQAGVGAVEEARQGNWTDAAAQAGMAGAALLGAKATHKANTPPVKPGRVAGPKAKAAAEQTALLRKIEQTTAEVEKVSKSRTPTRRDREAVVQQITDMPEPTGPVMPRYQVLNKEGSVILETDNPIQITNAVARGFQVVEVGGATSPVPVRRTPPAAKPASPESAPAHSGTETPMMSPLKEANKYLNLLKDKRKRDQGWAYLNWLKQSGVGHKPFVNPEVLSEIHARLGDDPFAAAQGRTPPPPAPPAQQVEKSGASPAVPSQPIPRATETPPAKSTNAPGVEMIDPLTVGVEKGLQYKQSEITDAANQVSGVLKGTDTYNVPQGGTWTVWRKADGSVVAVNSHHRRDLAHRAKGFVEPTPGGGYKESPRSVPMRVLNEADGWTKEAVRAYGVLENIRDGKGNALDAVMALHDLKITPDKFGNHQISLTGNMARDVKGLYGLAPDALGRVRSGDVSDAVGSGIGSVRGLEPSSQMGAMDEAARSGIANYAEARRLAEHYLEDQQSGALKAESDNGDLFGGEFQAPTSTRGTRVKIEQSVSRAISDEHRQLLKGAGVITRDGEYIDKEGRTVEAAKYGGKPAEVAERVRLVFDKNPLIKDEVKRLAGEVSNGRLSVQEAAGQLSKSVRHFAQQSAREILEGGADQPGNPLRADSGHGDTGQAAGFDSLFDSAPVAPAADSPTSTPKTSDRIQAKIDEQTKLLKKDLGKLLLGPDPEVIARAAYIGSLHIAKGVVRFGEWSAQMLEYGSALEPHLQHIWAQAWKLHRKNPGSATSTPDAPPPVAVATDRTTSARNAVSNTERAALGLDEMPTPDRKSRERSLNLAIEKGYHDPDRASSIADQVLKGAEKLDDEKTQGLAYRKLKLIEENDALLKEAAATNDPTALARIATEKLAKQEQFDKITLALKKGGTEAARALSVRASDITPDMSVLAMKSTAKISKGAPLTAAEETRIEALHKALAAKDAEIAAHTARITELEAAGHGDREIKGIIRRERRDRSRAAIDKEWTDLNAELEKILGKQTVNVGPKQLADAAPVIVRMAKNRAALGANTVSAVVDSVTMEVNKFIPGATAREVRDVISGYGRARTRTASPEAAKVRDLQAQMRLISMIEDVEAGAVPAQGTAPGAGSTEVKALRKQLDDLMDKTGIKPKRQTTPATLADLKTRTQERIDTLRKAIETATPLPPKPKTARPFDAHLDEMKIQQKQVRRAYDQMVERLGRTRLQNIGAKADSYRYFNMLSNPRTFLMTNLIGNTAQVGMKGAERALSTHPRETIAAAGGHVRGMVEGLRDFRNILKKGFTHDESLQMDYPHEEIGGGLANPLNVPTRVMRAVDAFFYQTAYHGEMAAQAARAAKGDKTKLQALIDSPTAEMEAAATAYAREATFRIAEEGPTAKLMTQFATLKEVPVFGTVVKHIAPFTNIAAEIARQGVNRTPVLGALRLGTKAGRADARNVLGQQAFGAGMAVTGYMAYQSGNVTGALPEDKKARERFYAEGKKPWSILVGGSWVPMKYFGPAALPFLSGAGIAEYGGGKEEMPKRKASEVSSKLGRYMADQSFLQGVSALMEALSDPEKPLDRFLANILSQYTPAAGAMRGVANTMDPVIRKPDSALDYWMAGIPGLTGNVPPLGTEQGPLREGGLLDAFLFQHSPAK